MIHKHNLDITAIKHNQSQLVTCAECANLTTCTNDGKAERQAWSPARYASVTRGSWVWFGADSPMPRLPQPNVPSFWEDVLILCEDFLEH